MLLGKLPPILDFFDIFFWLQMLLLLTLGYERTDLSPKVQVVLERKAKDFQTRTRKIWKKYHAVYETDADNKRKGAITDPYFKGNIVIDDANVNDADDESDMDFDVEVAEAEENPAPPIAPNAGKSKPFAEKGTSQKYAAARAVKASAEPGAILLAAKQTAKHIDPDIQYVLRRMTELPGLPKKLKKWIQKDPSKIL